MSDHVFDELPALLAGELSRDETAATVAHLRSCEECRHELVAAAAAAAALRSAARHAPVEVQTPAPVPTALPSAGGRLPSRRWAVGSAVAAAVAVVAIAAFLVVGRGDGGTPPQRVALEPVAAGTAAGDVTMRADGGSTAMTVSTSGLRRPQHGYYEVWLLDPATNKMLPVGVLPPSGGSTYDLPASVIGRYSAVDVSLEPDDGNPAHSTDSVLRGTYRA